MVRTIRNPQQQQQRLVNGSMPGGWWHELEGSDRIVCDLCPRACSLKPGDRGFCFVRENVDGEMRLSTYGHSTGFCVDPIEKKPLNHFLPGTAVLSFGTAGCNLGCKFCQNWDISKSREVERASEAADPATIAEAAVQLQCHSVAFTYNDPVIWAEYAVDTARECHARGVKTVAVTAGYITADARSYFFQEMDAANVDLKAFSEEFYQKVTYSHLQPVLDTLVWLQRETDVWFELTNLIIPQENDSPDELRRMCDWIVRNLGDEVPVHFTAFHPDFRLRDRPATPVETLLMAYEQAKSVGIKYPYVGNVHDPVHDSTYCPYCSAPLIRRNWHEISRYHLVGNRCHRCNGVIAGRFLQQAGSWGRRRLPVRIADFAQPDKAAREHQAASVEPIVHAVEGISSSGRREPSRVVPGPTARDLMLAPQQEAPVFRAACEFVVAGVGRRPAAIVDPTLHGSADLSVMGVFVTLKRKGHLRACCGSLGQPMPLMEALRAAAHRTATDDTRLPPLSTTELRYLDVDVSLLSNFRELAQAGVNRVGAIEIGRHGLTIHRGQSGGLLLPAVAVENGWDAETFLRQVCRKAGLPSNAWEDDGAKVQTFETTVLSGTIPDDMLEIPAPAVPQLLSSRDLQLLAEHCRANVLALLQGATPNYYLPDCSDCGVQGVVLAIEFPAGGASPQFARLSLRPGLPLQSTLFQLADAAARWIGSLQLPWQELSGITAHVAVLYDSALHGTVDEPDLRGFDPQRRALVVATHGRYAWSYDPASEPAELLERATSKAQVFEACSASVFSFATDATAPSFLVTNVPRPQSGPSARKPAVAGVFYPAESAQLGELVEQLTTGSDQRVQESWPAVMVPHAGLQYSGRIAAQVFQSVAIPRRVIILAPKHTRLGTPWAVAPHESWLLPGLRVASDPELAHRLAEAIPRLELDAAAHLEEHAIEVQIPLLARLAPDTKVVGIAIGEGGLEDCREFARQLAQLLREEPAPPLLVISSDLNHYASDEENRRLDRIALDALHRLDPAYLFHTVRQHDISMCGLLPAVIVLQTLHNLGCLRTCRQVAYATSADAGGSGDRVVGYAGLLLG